MKFFKFFRRFGAVCCTAALMGSWAGAQAVQDFTFIHVSDLHFPRDDSAQTLRLLRGVGESEVDLRAFGLTVPAPSFIVASGDLVEFSGGNGWWESYINAFEGVNLPVFHALGNHDNTWQAMANTLRGVGLASYYSFDAYGCRFIVLNSATYQDPRPSFGEEQIVWLRKEMEGVTPDTPVFLVFHHPLEGREFSSSYDWRRVLDVMRPYNVASIHVGHYHSVTAKRKQAVDEVIGGSTFGPNSGFAFVSVKDDTLRVAYQRIAMEAPEEKMLEKPLFPAVRYPEISITKPASSDKETLPLSISATLTGRDNITSATFTINDKEDLSGALELKRDGGQWTAEGLFAGTLLPGSHFLTVEFKSEGEDYSRSTQFFVEPVGSPTVWRKYLEAASKATPVVHDGVVYVGTNDGRFWALDAATGEVRWKAETRAEILTSALVHDGAVYFGNGDGRLFAYSLDGSKLWEFKTGQAFYSTGVAMGDRVIFACNDGHKYALDARTGRLIWKNGDPEYSIESPLFAWDGKVYSGSWDQHIRCVDASTGELLWKEIGEGSRIEAAKRYYSPGDAMPVVAGGKVFAADRRYNLTILDAKTGERLGTMEGVAATGLSEDGNFIYLRRTTGNLVKMDTDQNVIWEVNAELNALPVAPVEKHGVVFVASAQGKVSAVSARFGRILWQYQASPQLFVMAGVGSDGVNAYVPAFDGHLTAIKTRQW